MTEESITEHCFTFNDITVEPQSNTIIKNGKSKRLEPKLIALLCFLAKNSNQVHSRQKLASEIWPNVIVGDETINRSIFALRNALGDSAKSPQYIETIPKKGYRFLVEITAQIADRQDKSGTSKAKNWLLWGLISVVLFIALSVYFSQQNKELQIKTISPVTYSAGNESSMAVSADNKKMLYIQQVEQQYKLLIRDLVSKHDVLITESSWTIGSPIWLTTESWLYIKYQDGESQIMHQQQNNPAKIIYKSNKAIYNLVLNPKQPNLILFNKHINGDTLTLFSLNIESGKIDNLNKRYPELPRIISNMHYSSDGEKIYIVTHNTQQQVLHTLNVISKEIKTLNSTYKNISDLTLDFTHQQLLVVGQYQSTQGIWLQPLNGMEPKLLLRTSGESKIRTIALDHINKQIYYDNFRFDSDISIASITHKTSNAPIRLNSQTTEHSGVFDHVNPLIYFVSNRSGNAELWRYNTATQQTEQVTHLQALNIGLQAISNNGQYMAMSYTSDKWQLAIIDLISGKSIITKNISQAKYPLGWSKDDEYLYVSEHPDHVSLFRYDRSTLTPSKIKSNAGLYVKNGKNTDEIYFIDYSSETAIKKNLLTNEETIVSAKINNLKNLIPGQVCINENFLVTITQVTNQFKVDYFPLINNKNNALPSLSKTILAPANVSHISNVHNDCDSFIYSHISPPSGEIMRIDLMK